MKLVYTLLLVLAASALISCGRSLDCPSGSTASSDNKTCVSTNRSYIPQTSGGGYYNGQTSQTSSGGYYPQQTSYGTGYNYGTGYGY